MKLSDFDYDLPSTCIAQQPMEPRDAARLLVSRPDGREDTLFRELGRHLKPGDLLVLNDTRVLPARLIGRKPTGGRVEILLLQPHPLPGHWLALARANKPLLPGQVVEIAAGFRIILRERQGDTFLVFPEAEEELATLLNRHGVMPLPPYITQTDPVRDRERYQTVFARQPGAVAAPTASLHFTQQLLDGLTAQGVETAYFTLHVGLGTFQPVREEDPRHHAIHREWCSLSADSADRINGVRRRGGRIVAVGTTAVRTLESAADETGVVHPFQGESDLYILPGYRFRAVDLMITNFHLPRTTLLLLVAAFIGKERLAGDYAHAIRSGYRFYSYGDASLLLPGMA